MRKFELPRWCGAVVCVLGIVCLLCGVYRGEMAVVFKKAVNICLECIGIG